MTEQADFFLPPAPAYDPAEGDPYPSMSPAELRDFIERHVWTYARTMPQCPHEYIVRKNVRDDAAFLRFVMTIRRLGTDEPWYARTHRYIDVGLWKYWTMGDWLRTTIIINRARIPHAPRPMVENPKLFVPIRNLKETPYVPAENNRRGS